MIAGTYVQTDQIRTAMNDITRTANSGVDAQMSPRKAFTSTFGANDLIDQRTVVRAVARGRCGRRPGRALPRPARSWSGARRSSRSSRRRSSSPRCASPSIRCATSPGGCPGSAARCSVNRKLAEDEHLSIGQRVGVTTRDRHQARAAGRHRRLRQRGLDRRGDAHRRPDGRRPVLVRRSRARSRASWPRRRPASRRPSSSARLRQALPRSLEIKTGEQTAADDAKQANDSIGSFLTPALLAFSGAALLVGAFIIFNTFSISVAQRRREFALLRSMGATRRQVARRRRRRGPRARRQPRPCWACSAAWASLRARRALRRSRVGHPARRACSSQARTIVIGLSVGHRCHPRRRPDPSRARHPGAAGGGDARRGAGRGAAARSRRRRIVTGLVGLAGLALLVQGLFGERPGQQPDRPRWGSARCSCSSASR